MRVVLELGDWVLAEDDAGEVRLWSNGVTGETRSYEDVPPEVAAMMAEESGPEIRQPGVEAPRPPQETQPFQRACGVAAEPASNAGAAPFTRQRGIAAAAPVPQGPPQSYAPDGADGWPAPLPDSFQGGGQAPDLERTAPIDPWAGLGDPAPSVDPWAGLGDPAESPSDAPAPCNVPMEPDPLVEKPACLTAPKESKEPTPGMLVKATTMKPHSSQSQELFLSKLTHLHLSEKGLTSLAKGFQLCPRLKVLNLERNRIQDLPGIQNSCEVLHLQGNDVWDLSSWTQNLPGLVTLELAENRLSVLSGLRRSTQLEGLGLRRQRSDLPLQLHVPTLRVFARSLRSLDISGNRMTDADFAPVAALPMLQRLDAASNMLADMSAVGAVLKSLTQLSRLHLTENPVCWMRKYRDLVIIACSPELEDLDGKAIQPNERPFLLELHQRRQRRNSSEPPSGRSRDSPTGSTPTEKGSLKPSERSSSLGKAAPPRPPGQAPPQAVIPQCSGPMARNRSRSGSTDPASRHYRRRAPATTKLPPLLPRVS